MKHPHLSRFSVNAWNLVFSGLRMGENIHSKDSRMNHPGPYTRHFVEMILSFVEKYKDFTTHEDLVVLALHDSLEEHPEYWRDILNNYGILIFRDVLVLSTGGIPHEIRAEIIHELESIYPKWEEIQDNEKDIHKRSFLECIKILSPQDPFYKLYNQSYYDLANRPQEFQQIELAMKLYVKKHLLSKKGKKVQLQDLITNPGYIGLGNYVFFGPKDLRRKVQDMLNNMADMKEMEKNKSGYIETRRIKAAILGAMLRIHGMKEEFSMLENAFQNAGFTMISHREIIITLQGGDEILFEENS